MSWHLTRVLAEINDGSETDMVEKIPFYSLSSPRRIKRSWYNEMKGLHCKSQVLNDFYELLLYCWA